MQVDEIRGRFLRFFEGRGHTVYSSDSLVPTNDPSLLFTSAGMNQFKDEFLGRVKGPRKAATCQKCLRTGDLEKVGKTTGHHTFFEMLGNFSFGDYFKKEAIIWAWEFLTKDLGLKEKDLWVSVYREDDEAYNIWNDIIKVPSEKILKLGAKENFWPADAPTQGPNGPCGPCSEIFYGGKDGVEVWNLVFTQFDREDGGRLGSLPNKNIDTGMGLERIARVMQGKNTNFEIDSFEPIIDTIKELLKDTSGKDIPKDKLENRINAIADHIRAVTFAIADGVFPSNEERGYVIRKLIRKAFWYGRSFGLEEAFLYKIVPVVAKVMKKPYPELADQREDIAQVVLSEEERFRNTIQEGLERLDEMIRNSKSSMRLFGEDVFKLYDTYGFPLELTQEIAGSRNIKVDLKGFKRCMENQRIASREASNIKKSIFDSISLEDRLDLTAAKFIEDKKEIKVEVLKIIVGNEARQEIDKGEKGSIFLKETNFYGEKGGQVGDKGALIKDGTLVADVVNTIDVAGRTWHEVVIKEDALKVGDTVTARIDIKRREDVRKNHTATHLLHNALRKVLGQHVKQAGSLVAPDRIRFDFTHSRALTDEEISRVEELVNEYINKNSLVEVKTLPLKEAKKQGVIALFGEKYADLVRMVSIGGYSKELCGGTHAKKTMDLGLFKIISESSIASGVRRIEAVTGEAARKKLKEVRDSMSQVAEELGVAPSEVPKRIEALIDKVRKIDKKIETIGQKVLQSSVENLLKNIKKIKNNEVVIGEIKNVDMKLLRKASDAIKTRLKNGIYVIISEKEGTLSMIVGLTSSIKDKDINAVKILNDIGSGFGIKGGGRPDFAQAGGRTEVDSKEIIKKAEQVIKNLGSDKG